MTSISVGKSSLEDYAPIIGETKVQEIRALAANLSGKTVCHVNSTSYGGGVSEILNRLVPLMVDAGLSAEWKVIEGSDEFFTVTKTIHNGLQGMNVPLTDQMKKTYLECNEANSKELDLNYNFVVIHDSQPAALIMHFKIKLGKWLWRCHVDLSHPNQDFMHFLTPIIFEYDALIFSMQHYVQEPLKSKRVAIIRPSIDPLSPKNRQLSKDQVLSVLGHFGVNPEKPIITQVSRFDPWKDPLGVIDVYKVIKREIPDVQLLLIASMAKDDPEGWEYYEKTARHASDDSDIHLLTDQRGVGDIEVNAFQRASNVVLQKSIREGFGLSVTEALWKEVPVVGGNVGGIPVQIMDGENGFLVNSNQEAVEKTLYLLKHPDVAKKMGAMGKQHVLDNFLITRHLEDYLKLFSSI